MNRTPIERVLDAVEQTTGQQPQKSGADFKCCCPAHEDRNPSLSISEGNDGRVLMTCHAGCSLDEVLVALRLEKRDLFPQSDSESKPSSKRKSSKPSRSWPKSADVIAVLERMHGPRSFAWTYPDADRKPVGIVVRWDLPDRKKEIRPVRLTSDGWQIGAMAEPRPLFRLPDIVAAETVFVVEGEKAAQAGESIGLPVTTCSGGCKAEAQTDWSPLAGKQVVIIPDNDKPGKGHGESVTRITSRLKPPATVRIIDLKALWPEMPEGGDLADYCDAHDSVEPETLREQIQALADRTEPIDFRDIPEFHDITETSRADR